MSFLLDACSEETPDAPVATETAAPAPGEPMDVNSAVKLVLKKALAHDGLCRGLRETTRAIEKHQAELCILAEDCDQPDYKKLVEALCAENNVNLLSVPEAKQLGQWAGVSVVALAVLMLCKLRRWPVLICLLCVCSFAKLTRRVRRARWWAAHL